MSASESSTANRPPVELARIPIPPMIVGINQPTTPRMPRRNIIPVTPSGLFQKDFFLISVGFCLQNIYKKETRPPGGEQESSYYNYILILKWIRFDFKTRFYFTYHRCLR